MRQAVHRHAIRTAVEALTGSDGPAAPWMGASLPFCSFNRIFTLTCPDVSWTPSNSRTITLAPDCVLTYIYGWRSLPGFLLVRHIPSDLFPGLLIVKPKGQRISSLDFYFV